MIEKVKKIHFIGICGVAMSALAIAFNKKGWKVTGSDVGFFPPISTHLQNNDIAFYPGWHPEKMCADGNPDVVVVGNVASSTNPEWIYVQENKLNYKSYPEVIAEYFVKENSIVCAGTYGKTSNTTLLSWIFKENNFDPSYMFGGLCQNDIDAAHLTDSKWSILEGDEYKSSRWDIGPKFAHYHPTHLLLTAVIWDHADVYPTEQSYFDVFEKLIKSVPKTGLIVACTNNKKVAEMIKTALCRVVTYGKNKKNDYVYSKIKSTKKGISFTISHKDIEYKIDSLLLGEYQVSNITGCFAMAHEAGIDAQKIISTIQTFRGIKRRLEKRLENDITVFDDIAHSPTKAQSVLETLRNIYTGKLIAVFEPNTGNRRPASFPGYDHAFAKADTVIIPLLTKVKIDKNDPEIPADGKQLAEVIKKTHKNVLYIEDDKKLIQYLSKNTKKDDCIVFLGSHGFRGMIDELIISLRQ